MSRKRKAGRAALPRSQKRKAVQQRRPTDELHEDSPAYRTDGTGEPRKLKFIDLFCGIGGFRLAFERAGCECVLSCD